MAKDETGEENKDYTIKLTERELWDILMAMDRHINHCDVSKERGWTPPEHYLTFIDRIRPLFARLGEISDSRFMG